MRNETRAAYRTCLARGAQVMDAEDARQETALRLIQGLPVSGSMVGHRVAIDRQRSNLGRIPDAYPTPTQEEETESPVADLLASELGSAALETLRMLAEGSVPLWKVFGAPAGTRNLGRKAKRLYRLAREVLA